MVTCVDRCRGAFGRNEPRCAIGFFQLNNLRYVNGFLAVGDWGVVKWLCVACCEFGKTDDFEREVAIRGMVCPFGVSNVSG